MLVAEDFTVKNRIFNNILFAAVISFFFFFFTQSRAFLRALAPWRKVFELPVIFYLFNYIIRYFIEYFRFPNGVG